MGAIGKSGIMPPVERVTHARPDAMLPRTVDLPGCAPLAATSPPLSAKPASLADLARRLRRQITLLDVVVFAMLGYYAVRLWLAPEGPHADAARPIFTFAAALFAGTVVAVRGDLVAEGYLRGLAYRVVVLVSVLGSYIVGMRDALHALQPTLVDAQLAELDRLIFGVVPSQWFEQFAEPAVVEWLAFWYFSYFAILLIAIVPAVVVGVSRVAAERVFGILFICSLGHIVYTLVPGRGPYAFLPFEGELVGGPFWKLVLEAVRTSGPLIDIFPSLHTAFTSFIALHAWRNRQARHLRRVWPLAAFAAANIMVATIFLRWHYAVDVIAGFALAVFTMWWVPRVMDRDEARVAEGRQPTFDEPVPLLQPQTQSG